MRTSYTARQGYALNCPLLGPYCHRRNLPKSFGKNSISTQPNNSSPTSCSCNSVTQKIKF